MSSGAEQTAIHIKRGFNALSGVSERGPARLVNSPFCFDLLRDRFI